MSRQCHASMKVSRKVVARNEQSSKLILGGFDTDDGVRLRVEEQARVNFFVCQCSRCQLRLNATRTSRLTIAIAHQ